MADYTDDVDPLVFQRRIAGLVLGEIGPVGFALAGSGAIREHGITDRPTRDIDLFTTTATSPEAFTEAVNHAAQLLEQLGFQVTHTRSTPEFARLVVESPDRMVVEVDFGIDWRGEPPAQLAVGPVLAVNDAVGNKVAAVYSRGEVRDFLDLDSIRQSGRFADRELIGLAREHDPGFDVATFSRQLRRISAFGYIETAEYGIDADHFDQIQQRTLAWADQLSQPATDHPATTTPEMRPSIDAEARERLRRQDRDTRHPWSDPSHDRTDGPEPPGL